VTDDLGQLINIYRRNMAVSELAHRYGRLVGDLSTTLVALAESCEEAREQLTDVLLWLRREVDTLADDFMDATRDIEA
jgi:hypothetical protein